MKLLVIETFFLVYVIGYACGYGRINYADLISQREIKKLENKLNRAAMMYEDPSDVSIYYSVIDNHPITDMMPQPWRLPGQSLRLPFIGEPCTCIDLQCGCCVGINITQFSFDHQACTNITYKPDLFGLVVDVSVDNYVLIHNIYSAQNPPPFCIPLVFSGLPTGIDMCVKLYDIYITGTNIHVCIDFETRIFSTPLLVLHFDCVQIGTDGVALVKPNSTDVLGEIQKEMEVTTLSDGISYDEVTEIKNDVFDSAVPAMISMLQTTTLSDGIIDVEVTEFKNDVFDVTTVTSVSDKNTTAHEFLNSEENIDEIMKKASFESQRINNRKRY